MVALTLKKKKVVLFEVGKGTVVGRAVGTMVGTVVITVVRLE